MEKRLFIAILVSIGFLWAWGMIAPRLFPELAPRKPVQTEQGRETQTPPDPSRIPSGDGASRSATLADDQPPVTPVTKPAGYVNGGLEPVRATQQQSVVLENEHIRATFTNEGAVLRSLRLKGYDAIGTEET
ncbi:MAG: hypothetical protein KY432_08720, partial [Acidobacteria bacterium]|nr:hypothetical protein [Acidobacteriota bacterium]